MSGLSRKHFIRLAEYIKDTKGRCEPFTPQQVEHLANFCHEFNARFSLAKWRAFIGEIIPTVREEETQLHTLRNAVESLAMAIEILERRGVDKDNDNLKAWRRTVARGREIWQDYRDKIDQE